MKVQTTAFLCISTLFACTLSQDADSPFGQETESSTAESGGSSTTEEDDDRPEPPPSRGAVANVCERIDECGFLPPGVRLSDCEDTTKMCLEDGLQSERSDWELFAADCLELENCFNFIACYEDLQTCELPLDIGTTGGFGGLSTSGGVLGTTTDGFEASTGSIFDPDDSSTTGNSGDDTNDDGGIDPPVCGGACNACVDCAFEGPCVAEAIACAANPSCIDLNDCYAECFDGPCYDLCDEFYPSGVADYAVLTECVLDSCASC